MTGLIVLAVAIVCVALIVRDVLLRRFALDEKRITSAGRSAEIEPVTERLAKLEVDHRRLSDKVNGIVLKRGG